MFRVPPEIYDAIYDRAAVKDYAAESRRVAELVRTENPGAKELLDVACGTGLHALHLARDFNVSGLDLDDRLLAAARARLPEASIHVSDMETFELPQRFDAITCLFSAIGCVSTIDRFERTLANFARHLEPSGVVLVEPWLTPDAFEVGRIDVQVVELPDMKIARMNTTARDGTLSILDMRYLVGTKSGVQVYEERHEMGLFTTEEQLACMERAGLRARHDIDGLMGRGLLIGRRPA